jgi:hypothetical protein
VDHFDVIGTCSSCHNGTIATGKNTAHIASGNNCEDCHTTNGWVPADFDHSTITNNCSGCHNGSTATGKHPGHINTGNICENCHSTTAWIPASFDHDNVTGSCSGCHNGNTATGKGGGHFITSQDCIVCHDTTGWVPSTFGHTTLSYEPLDHRGTQDCTECHQSNSATVNWPSPTYQPDCAGCHANDYKHSESKHNGLSADRDCTGSRCHRISDRKW